MRRCAGGAGGGGATVIPELVVAQGLVTARSCAAGFRCNARFHILRHKERYRSRAADTLLEIVGEG